MISDDGREVRVEEVLQEGVPGDRYEDKDQIVHSCPSRSIAKPASHSLCLGGCMCQTSFFCPSAAETPKLWLGLSQTPLEFGANLTCS